VGEGGSNHPPPLFGRVAPGGAAGLQSSCYTLGSIPNSASNRPPGGPDLRLQIAVAEINTPVACQTFREERTMAETPRVDLVDDDMETTLRAFGLVIAHVRKTHGPYVRRQSADVQGTMPCPICGSDLRYSRAAYNGHHHAHCAKAGCLHIMQ
jgi:hypothetical protein